jgi:hypothetical protein
MARLLEQQPLVTDAEENNEESAGTARATARALATALALLMISLLVVTRSRDAFDSNPAQAEASFTTGDVRLTDDDNGSTLFDIPNMVPGRPASDCIAVTYEGDVLPVDVHLDASADGALVGALLVKIESGTGGGFQNCGGFHADGVLYDGTLHDLAESRPLAAFTAEETPAARTFRFTFDLDPDVPVEGHATASADLAWTADS